MRKQVANEGFDVFYTDLRNLAAKCEYDGLKDWLISDRIVWKYLGQCKDRLVIDPCFFLVLPTFPILFCIIPIF